MFKKNLSIRLTMLLIFICTLFLTGCIGLPPKDIQEDLQPEEFFRDAQSAVVAWGSYSRALEYYEEFIRRYPDMKSKIIEAEYEIAFIYYQEKKYDVATMSFNNILDKYKTEEVYYYPDWVRVLSEKLLVIIDQEINKKNMFVEFFKNLWEKMKKVDINSGNDKNNNLIS